MRAAASRTFCTAGRSSPMRTAMMAMTTSSSINVKPCRRPFFIQSPSPSDRTDEPQELPHGARGVDEALAYSQALLTIGPNVTRQWAEECGPLTIWAGLLPEEILSHPRAGYVILGRTTSSPGGPLMSTAAPRRSPLITFVGALYLLRGLVFFAWGVYALVAGA